MIHKPCYWFCTCEILTYLCVLLPHILNEKSKKSSKKIFVAGQIKKSGTTEEVFCQAELGNIHSMY